MKLRDARGSQLELERPPRRVVSLVPSVTETLFALGAGDAVVGITDYCIFPEGLAVERVGGTKNPRVDEIRALAPDLVHMNLEENLRRDADAVAEFAPLFVTEPKSIDDVDAHLTQLGELHGCEAKAAQLRGELERARGAIVPRAFTFAVPIWKDPWMWCGGDTYVSRLVECAGGRNVLAQQTRYPHASLEEVVALRPDIVFLPDEPYLFTAEDAAAIVGPEVIGPFPGHLFTWHGVRSIEGLKFLRDALEERFLRA